MSGPLDRAGPCPQCGATIVFPFAAASTQVCRYCRFAVMRTDREFALLGKVGDLLPIPSPLPVGAFAQIAERRFRVAGRVQYDRQGAASAPWQELFVEESDGRWAWIALAQGRFYWTSPWNAGPLPSFHETSPGLRIDVAGAGTFMVTERGGRWVISAEGELPFPFRPGAIERYVDLSGPDGAFGTIDYGDGSAAPKVFVGREIDPGAVRVGPGTSPVTEPTVATVALSCPKCSASLPLAAPGSAARVICRYCGMQSDVAEGALRALSAIEGTLATPEIPLGSKGHLRGLDVIVVGYMVRGTTVEGERYRWREYLLFAPATSSYVFLLEEDGEFRHIVPIAGGDVTMAHPGCSYRGESFAAQPAVRAEVEQAIGEFYWKVQRGEAVTATDYDGLRGVKLSEERTGDEVVWSLSRPIPRSEISRALGLDVAEPRHMKARRGWANTAGILLLVWTAITIASCASKGEKSVFAGAALVPAEPNASAADASFFTPAFVIERDRRSLEVQLTAQGLSNGWITADVALVRDDTGDVEEASVDFEYYEGVEGGESWSEGSRDARVVFSRIPAGRYLVRIDPVGDLNGAKSTLGIRIVHDTWSALYVFGSFGLLVVVLTLFAIAEHRRA